MYVAHRLPIFYTIPRTQISTFSSAVSAHDIPRAFTQDEASHDTWNFLRQSEAYKLIPLTRETCTRVLTIIPSDDKTSPVSLRVEEIDLAGSYDSFVAISHVWGSNPHYSRFAICNGKPYSITGRVDSLLRRIRMQISEDSRHRHWNRIWIDTICIDQSDDVLARKEKNHQVSIMHKIFGDAREVVVDLGPADKYSHLLSSAKADIVRLREKAFDDEYCRAILGFSSSVNFQHQDTQRVRQSLEACSRLLDKQWMSRIWTVQEYALAQKCSFLSGNMVIDGGLLSELGELASDVNANGRSHLAMLFSKFRRAVALTKLPRLSRIREESLESEKRLTFGESLALGWHHDCTDERDTVYALQALVDYRGPPLKVDYNEPSSRLSRRVSRKLVELGDYEAVLAGARGLAAWPTADDGPSWTFLMRPSFKFVGEERHWILSGKPTKFRAGGVHIPEHPPLTLSLNTEDYLQAKVSFIGIITVVSENFPRIPQFSSNATLPIERLYTFNTERTIHTRAVIFDTWLRHILPRLNRARGILAPLNRRSDELWRATTHGHNGIELDQSWHTDQQQRIDYWNMLVDISSKGLEIVGYQRDPDATLKSDIRALEQAMHKRHLLMNEMTKEPQDWIDQIHHEIDQPGDCSKEGVARVLSKAEVISAQAGISTATAKATSSDQDHDHTLRHLALISSLVNSAFDIRNIQATDQLKMLERRLAVLQDGRLISVPDAARAGDVVVVLSGISVPYVLREIHGDDESEPEFKIAGMAYVDDVMYGAAVNERTEWKSVRII